MPAETKLLAFDTSTEALSVAVRRGDRVLSRSGPGGAQASSSLIPLIQDLLAEAGLALAELDAIAFGRGPGSFTGLRTACSVAQGLGFGAGVPLLPVDTLACRGRGGAPPLRRHARGRAARCAHGRALCRALRLRRAQAAEPTPSLGCCRPSRCRCPPGWVLAGNVFSAYGDRLPRRRGAPRGAARRRGDAEAGP